MRRDTNCRSQVKGSARDLSVSNTKGKSWKGVLAQCPHVNNGTAVQRPRGGRFSRWLENQKQKGDYIERRAQTSARQSGWIRGGSNGLSYVLGYLSSPHLSARYGPLWCAPRRKSAPAYGLNTREGLAAYGRAARYIRYYTLVYTPP